MPPIVFHTPGGAATGAAPPQDLAAVLQQAIVALQKVIEAKPDGDRLLAEMVRICGQALGPGRRACG